MFYLQRTAECDSSDKKGDYHKGQDKGRRRVLFVISLCPLCPLWLIVQTRFVRASRIQIRLQKDLRRQLVPARLAPLVRQAGRPQVLFRFHRGESLIPEK